MTWESGSQTPQHLVDVLHEPRPGLARGQGARALHLLQGGDLHRKRPMGVAGLVHGGAGRVARLHGGAHGGARRRLVRHQRGKLAIGLGGPGRRALGLLLSACELERQLGGAPLHHLHVGEAMGERLGVLGMAATRRLALGGHLLSVLGKGGKLAFQRAAAHSQIAVDRVQVRYLLLGRIQLAGRLLVLGRRAREFGCRLVGLHGVGLDGKLQLAGPGRGGPTPLAQHHGRGVESLDGRRRRAVAPRQVAGVQRLLADALLQGLHSGLGLLDGAPSLLQLGGKRRLPRLGRVPLLLQPVQIVHGDGEAHLGLLRGELLVGARLFRLALQGAAGPPPPPRRGRARGAGSCSPASARFSPCAACA